MNYKDALKDDWACRARSDLPGHLFQRGAWLEWCAAAPELLFWVWDSGNLAGRVQRVLERHGCISGRSYQLLIKCFRSRDGTLLTSQNNRPVRWGFVFDLPQYTVLGVLEGSGWVVFLRQQDVSLCHSLHEWEKASISVTGKCICCITLATLTWKKGLWGFLLTFQQLPSAGISTTSLSPLNWPVWVEQNSASRKKIGAQTVQPVKQWEQK